MLDPSLPRHPLPSPTPLMKNWNRQCCRGKYPYITYMHHLHLRVALISYISYGMFYVSLFQIQIEFAKKNRNKYFIHNLNSSVQLVLESIVFYLINLSLSSVLNNLELLKYLPKYLDSFKNFHNCFRMSLILCKRYC